jgi:hypothetical protein
MLINVVWVALIMSALNWLMFVLLTIIDMRQSQKRPRDEQQAGITDAAKIAEATGSLAGAFKKAGAAPTAAAMSVLCLLIALIAAGVAKF